MGPRLLDPHQKIAPMKYTSEEVPKLPRLQSKPQSAPGTVLRNVFKRAKLPYSKLPENGQERPLKFYGAVTAKLELAAPVALAYAYNIARAGVSRGVKLLLLLGQMLPCQHISNPIPFVGHLVDLALVTPVFYETHLN